MARLTRAKPTRPSRRCGLQQQRSPVFRERLLEHAAALQGRGRVAVDAGELRALGILRLQRVDRRVLLDDPRRLVVRCGGEGAAERGEGFRGSSARRRYACPSAYQASASPRSCGDHLAQRRGSLVVASQGDQHRRERTPRCRGAGASDERRAGRDARRDPSRPRPAYRSEAASWTPASRRGSAARARWPGRLPPCRPWTPTGWRARAAPRRLPRGDRERRVVPVERAAAAALGDVRLGQRRTAPPGRSATLFSTSLKSARAPAASPAPEPDAPLEHREGGILPIELRAPGPPTSPPPRTPPARGGSRPVRPRPRGTRDSRRARRGSCSTAAAQSSAAWRLEPGLVGRPGIGRRETAARRRRGTRSPARREPPGATRLPHDRTPAGEPRQQPSAAVRASPVPCPGRGPCPSRCRMPCTTSRVSSSCSSIPRSAAFRRRVSTEITMSPAAARRPAATGRRPRTGLALRKESTSVARSLPR